MFLVMVLFVMIEKFFSVLFEDFLWIRKVCMLLVIVVDGIGMCRI